MYDSLCQWKTRTDKKEQEMQRLIKQKEAEKNIASKLKAFL